MRAAVLALVPMVLTAAAAGTPPPVGNVAFVERGRLVVVDVATGFRRVVAAPVSGPPGLSGDGRLVSVDGRIVGGPSLTKGQLAWAPRGETAAFSTRDGGVSTWSPAAGRRVVVRGSWGASSFAWGPNGELALARSICRVPCGAPRHQEVWIWRTGSLRKVAGPLRGFRLPRVAGVEADGRALWWSNPQGSASIAADGLWLYANRTRIAPTLAYPDYVSVCGRHLALAAGGDRYAMRGKRILLDGRDVSRDRSRSWVSPSCSRDGTRLVAAASVNTTPPRIGREHRAIWQLLPARRRLTRPPARRTDEYPRVLADGSVVFVRTRTRETRTALWGVGIVEVLRRGKLTRIGTAGGAANFYGHYDWPHAIAVAP